MPKSESPKAHSKKPVSEKQLAANRANAAKSTGPTSDPGKARSSRNACKHGLASENFTVIRLEDTDEVARLRADAIAVYQPVNSQELRAVEQIAIRQQAMLRAARCEAGLFSACLNECLESDGSARFPLHEDVTYGIEVTLAQNRNYMLADGFFRLARQGNGIQLFLRYQAQAERLYRRAVEEFERLKKLRPELPNEPILEEDQDPDPAEPQKDIATPPPAQNEPNPSPGSRPGTEVRDSALTPCGFPLPAGSLPHFQTRGVVFHRCDRIKAQNASEDTIHDGVMRPSRREGGHGGRRTGDAGARSN